MSYYIPTYLDSCVYYRSDFLQRNQHKQHHHIVEQDLYMSLTYSVIHLHKSQNMLPSLSNRPSHHQLETERLLLTKWVSREEENNSNTCNIYQNMNYDHKRAAGYQYIEWETVRSSYNILRLHKGFNHWNVRFSTHYQYTVYPYLLWEWRTNTVYLVDRR